MLIKVKKLHEDAKMPYKACLGDAGWDLFVHSKSYDENDNVVYGCGLAMEIPEGYVGLVFPRSSNSKKALLLSNSVGVIDSGYRGEIMAKFRKTYVEKYGIPMHDESSEYEIGDRFCQLIIMPFPAIDFEEADELSQSERGTQGYGGSGR